MVPIKKNIAIISGPALYLDVTDQTEAVMESLVENLPLATACGFSKSEDKFVLFKDAKALRLFTFNSGIHRPYFYFSISGLFPENF